MTPWSRVSTPWSRASLPFLSFLGLIIAFNIVSCTKKSHDGDVKHVQVSNVSIAKHSIDDPYIVDAISGGTVYELPSIADRQIVQVRSPIDVPLQVLARRFSDAKSIRVGNLTDLETVGFGFPGDAPDEPGVEASCDGPSAGSPGICNCTGRKDCSDMSKAGMCTGGGNQSAVCGQGSNGHWGCSCVAKGS